MTTNEPPPYPGEPNPSANDPQNPPPPAGEPPSYGSAPPPPGSYPPPPAGGYPPPPGGYPPPAPGGYGPPAPQQNKMAMWSMIVGIVSVVGLCCTFGGLLGIVSIILGVLSRKEISKSNGTQTGAGMAIAGIVTGAVGIVVSIAIIVLYAAGVLDANYTTDFN